MKAVVAAFNQEKALVGAFSVITNLHLKSSRQLELVVRKRAGLELFPSESSGYDSSASSSVGDTEAETGRDLNHNKVGISLSKYLPNIIKTFYFKVKISVAPPPAPPPAIPQNTRNHEDTKRRLEEEMEAERRRLASEQARLRREAEQLSAERRQLEEEKQQLRNTLGKSAVTGGKSAGSLADVGQVTS